MLIHDPPYSECKCDLDPARLILEIHANRPVHEFRERLGTGGVVLVCLQCEGLWNHRWTDLIVAMVQSGEAWALIENRANIVVKVEEKDDLPF